MMESINLCQRGRGSIFFEKIFCQKNIFFAIAFEENTTIRFLQPIILGRNDLYMNNRYVIFSRFIFINNTVHHLCKYLYLKYAMQNKLSNFYFEE